MHERITRTGTPAPGRADARIRPRPAGQPRGVVAFLMTDIEGSTPLWESSPAAMRLALETHDRILRRSIARHGGYVFCQAGDSFAAAFADPSRATKAAVDAQLELRARSWPDQIAIRVRMAVHAGVAHERDGNYFGLEVNRCARLLDICAGGEIVVSDTVAPGLSALDGWSLTDTGDCRLRGLSESERVWRLEHRSPAAAMIRQPNGG